MKKNIFILIILFGGLLSFVSCDKETEDISRITYYSDLQLKGAAQISLKVGETYVEPGFTAEENEEDVSENVVVSGTVNNNEPGAYTLVYKVKNVDGFEKTTSRLILVAPEEVSSLDISGVYTGQREGKAITPDACQIINLGNGVFKATDFLGGYYNIIAGYGPAYSLGTYFYLKPDNTYESLSNNSAFGPWDILNGVYNPTTKVLTHKVDQDGFAFNVTLTKQ